MVSYLACLQGHAKAPTTSRSKGDRLPRHPGNTPLSPAALLILLVWLTGLAAGVDAVLRRRRGRALRRLAAEWGMNYSPADSFRVAAKIARDFPVPGAAGLRVTDVVYGTEKGRHRYVFTAEFTTGVVGVKQRVSRVAAFTESRDRDRAAREPADLLLAPEDGDLLEQYRRLAPPGKGQVAARADAPTRTDAGALADEAHTNSG